MLATYLPKVGIKLYKLATHVISEYCSLFPYLCSSDQSLLLFKFKIFALNTSIIIIIYNATIIYICICLCILLLLLLAQVTYNQVQPF